MKQKRFSRLDRKMDPYVLDKLLQSKMHRELDLRRPFEKVIRATEQRREKLQVTPTRPKEFQYDIARVPTIKEFKEYFKLHRAFLESCPDAKMTRLQMRSLLQSYLASPRTEKLMQQVHCMVKQLLQITADGLKEESKQEALSRRRIISPQESGFNIPFMAPQLHTLFSPIRRLASSRLRDIYSMGFDGTLRDCFVLKYPTSLQEGLYSSVHETVISYRTNILRAKTTAFQYGLGGFFCSMKENLCDSRYPATFLSIYEFIPGDTLEKALETLNRSELLQILLQIGNALLIGNRELRFRHNRLVCRNIILKKQAEKKMSVGIYKFTTTLQPVLTDFSHSILFHESSNEWIIPSYINDKKRYPVDIAKTDIPGWDLYLLLHSIMYVCYMTKLTEHLTLISQILRWMQTQMKTVFLLEDLVKLQQFPYAEISEIPDVSKRTDLVDDLSHLKIDDWMKYIVSLLS